jgi:transposase
MDNLAPHTRPAVARRIAAAGARRVLRPPYSPDLNPIALATSTVTAVLRTLARRTVPALYDAIGDALRAVTPADAVAYFKHRGYVLQ